MGSGGGDVLLSIRAVEFGLCLRLESVFVRCTGHLADWCHRFPAFRMSTVSLPSPVERKGLLLHLYAVMPEAKRVRVKSLLQSGLVHVNGVSVTRHDFEVGPSDRIQTRVERAIGERSLPFKVLYEDKHLIAIDKPSGLLTVGNKFEKAKTVFALVNHALRPTRERACIVHRLDLYTSGVLVLAKNDDDQGKVMRNWGKAQKTYHALVEGVPAKVSDQLTHYLREDERLIVHASLSETPRSVKAILSYKVIERSDGFALLEIRLETGKKNQIRAQLCAIGHPIAGDAKYGATANPLGRLCLHASSLKLPHPKTGVTLKFEAPLPKGFRSVERTPRGSRD